MNRIVFTYNAANSGAIIPLNFNNVSVGIGFACVVSGTVNYTVNHTYDDIYNSAITPTWWPDGQSSLVGATTSQEGNFVLPVSAMQIVINSGTGSVTTTILQQGII